MRIDDILARFDCVRRSGDGWVARCPAHEDTRASLSIGEGDKGVVLHCFSGCDIEAITAAIGVTVADLFPTKPGGTVIPFNAPSTGQPHGLTLSAYAAAKALPEDFLRALGLADVSYLSRPAVRMPVLDEHGAEVSVQFRIALDGTDRFRFKSGSRPAPYGRDRLAAARQAGEVVLVEGPSDYQTAVFHKLPAYGLPSATAWREDRDAIALADISIIYVVMEPDRGGEALLDTLGRSRLRDRVRVVRLDGIKDLSALHLAAPDRFDDQWAAAKAMAPTLTGLLAEAIAKRREELGPAAKEVAEQPDVLSAFAREIRRAGVVGEERAAKLVYLVVTTRLLDRPSSAKVHGPSSAGKNFLVDQTLRFFPASAYYALTAMSEKSLAYGDEPLKHRVLVLYEAAALTSDFGSYLVRSLLSEGCIRYETVEKTANGLRPRIIEREGPTSLLITTTSVKLHPENETRLLAVPITDTPEQTRAVMKATATGADPGVDVQGWQTFQEWLAAGDCRVTVPYGRRLAELIPPVAVRLRRDFRALLTLIRAHALLHQATRTRDADGRVVATVDDYAAVRELVADLIADTLDAAVPASIRDTVDAVAALAKTVATTISAVAAYLNIDKSAASRRVHAAISRGYLKNLETTRGRPARLLIDEPLPADAPILPAPDALTDGGCSVDRETAAIDGSPAPAEPAADTLPIEDAHGSFVF